VITGASLVHRQLDARQKACLVADVLDGMVTFTPSAKQLADIFDVSVPYINVARRLSAGKRTAILRGRDPVSFTGLMNPPPRQLSLMGPVIPDMRMTDTTKITNSYLETVIRAVGVDRALEAAIAAERN
jgi:hypothetical protein